MIYGDTAGLAMKRFTAGSREFLPGDQIPAHVAAGWSERHKAAFASLNMVQWTTATISAAVQMPQDIPADRQPPQRPDLPPAQAPEPTTEPLPPPPARETPAPLAEDGLPKAPAEPDPPAPPAPPRRRGRPPGSRNRPKTAATSSHVSPGRASAR